MQTRCLEWQSALGTTFSRENLLLQRGQQSLFPLFLLLVGQFEREILGRAGIASIRQRNLSHRGKSLLEIVVRRVHIGRRCTSSHHHDVLSVRHTAGRPSLRRVDGRSGHLAGERGASERAIGAERRSLADGGENGARRRGFGGGGLGRSVGQRIAGGLGEDLEVEIEQIAILDGGEDLAIVGVDAADLEKRVATRSILLDGLHGDGVNGLQTGVAIGVRAMAERRRERGQAVRVQTDQLRAEGLRERQIARFGDGDGVLSEIERG